MKRLDLFEFEDHPALPGWIRSSMTNVLAVLVNAVGVPRDLATHLHPLMKTSKTRTIVDLGSGGGGAMPEVVKLLRTHPDTEDVELVMTDKFPNETATQTFNSGSVPYLSYATNSVDACELQHAPEGVKTLVNSFHHLSPTQARALLASAQRTKSPIVIYEMVPADVPFLLWALCLPITMPLVFLSALLLTPFAQGVSIKQLVWTYLIPVIPALYTWDGQASVQRIYGPSDVQALLPLREDNTYQWTIEYDEVFGIAKKSLTITGRPSA